MRPAAEPYHGAMPELQHTQQDAAVVEAQLGRPLRGRWAVARRCHLGVPMVIENHPRLEDSSPFPTLFWLTCPILVKRVSRQESSGALPALGERLSKDPDLRERFYAALSRYRARRDEHEVIEDSGSPPGGGPDKVKCLHAHVAHQLAGGRNPVGALTLSRSDFPDCIAPCYEATDA